MDESQVNGNPINRLSQVDSPYKTPVREDISQFAESSYHTPSQRIHYSQETSQSQNTSQGSYS